MTDPFDFNWEPTEEVGELGKEYGLQPPGILPINEDPDFLERFKIKQDDPDIEF